ncbi:testis-expressed protein 47, partial [Symphorus nematophorus]
SSSSSSSSSPQNIFLQRMILVARLPHHLADRTELGAHYEKLSFQLSKQLRNRMTGLLLIYPSCVLHVIESTREVLFSVLRDLNDMKQQPDSTLLEAPKVVFVAYTPQSRLFQQWSFKELSADQGPANTVAVGEEESTETLVCTVLSTLQKLGEHLETSKKALPASVLDETPELIVPQALLGKLFARDDLLTPQQYLELYDAPLNISMDFSKRLLPVEFGIQS